MVPVRNLIAGVVVLGVLIALGAVESGSRSGQSAVPGRGRRISATPAAGSGAVRPEPLQDAAPVSSPVSRPAEATAGVGDLLAALDRGEDANALGILEGLAAPDALNPDELDRLLQACLRGHDPHLRAALLYWAGMIDLEPLRGIVPQMVRFDPEPEVRRAAIQLAAELRGDEMRGAILDAFSAADPAVRADAVSAMACLKGEEPAAFDRVAAALRTEPDAAARAQMAQALASLDDARVDPLLREMGLASAGDPAAGPRGLPVH